MGYANSFRLRTCSTLYSAVAITLLTLSPAVAAHAQSTDCNANGQDDATEFDLDGDGVINACDTCLFVPIDFYGALYNNAALALPALCPTGWRLPTEQDFIDLITFVEQDGFAAVSSGALKASAGWRPGDLGFDEYGFGGLPAGYAAGQGSATGAGVVAAWATTRQDLDSVPLTRRVFSLDLESGPAVFFDNATRLGATVRCIKNAS